MLLARHRGPLTADLRRFYGLRLVDARADVAAGRLTLGELADYAVNLPPAPESAVARAQDPDWWLTWELRVARQMELNSRTLIWHKTKDGQSGRNPPELLFSTEREVAERRAARRASDPLLAGAEPTSMPLDEAAKRLGF